MRDVQQEQNNEQTEVQGQDDQPRDLQAQNVTPSDVQQEQNVDTNDVQEQIVKPNDVQQEQVDTSDVQQEQNAEPIHLQQEQIVEPNDVQQEQNEKMGIKRKQKRRQRKLVKSKQHKKSKISRRVDEFSSSDDNMPLLHLQQHKQIDSEVESIIESGDSFKPSKEDYNSSDSNLLSPLINEIGSRKERKNKLQKAPKKIL